MQLAGFEIVHDQSGVRTVGGVLAGSALALDQAVRNLVAFAGCELVHALATVTSTPADLLGLTDRGRLRVGARADLTILDHHAELVATIVDGRLAHGHLRRFGERRRRQSTLPLTQTAECTLGRLPRLVRRYE